MDNSGQNANDSNTKVVIDTATELAHIAQEVYKKNFELAEKNKTLSLLRKIDEIVLGAVTDTHQMSQQVADVVAKDAGFQVVAIYLIEKKDILSRVAVSSSEFMQKLRDRVNREIFQDEIRLSDESNVIVKSVREQQKQIIQGISSLLALNVVDGSLGKIEETDEIKSTLIYPLKIRGKSLGVLIVGIRENGDEISQFQIDLVERLVDIVGIAIDNAFLYQEIKEANERLKELDRLKDDFVSVASHELRTPMTAIKSYLWMALAGQGGPLNEKQTYYLQRSYNSVDRLIKLVNDMLNISRIDSGRLTVQIQRANIVELVRGVVDDVGPRASELGITVVLEQQGVMPEVLADPDKIKEVVYNLIGNSMKFTPKGGKVIVSFDQKDKMVEVIVKDTGAGMDQEDLSKLFQKFGILPGSYVTNQPAMGTGLGLYICRSLIELHGGKIWVTSEGKGLGSTFIFSLKVFNQDDLNKFNEKYLQQGQAGVGFVHKEI
jgi:signal transduction histidine kinase